ncbi:hypothetical protein ACLI1A_01010 [Flavobacterium sp. RHBU_3]|uniref:hypothetical protein n=1 Tax=Flavobacterium sp. RHBU_3 TaxID=3391184 RepID=UPI003985614E
MESLAEKWGFVSARISLTYTPQIMTDEIIKIVIEKGLIGVLIIIVGFYLNKFLEIDKQRNILKNKITETTRDKNISIIEKQLSNFYYPIYFRLQRDNALWKLSPQLYKTNNQLPAESNSLIENEYILKNHREILSIIENNIHLIEIDDKLQEAINLYIKHITVYEIIRKTESIKNLNPIDFDAKYPHTFMEIITQKMKYLQNKNNSYLEEFRI